MECGGRTVRGRGRELMDLLDADVARDKDARDLRAAVLIRRDVARLRQRNLSNEEIRIRQHADVDEDAVHGQRLPLSRTLAQEIDGIGFITADTIAMAAGWERNSSERIAAGLFYEVSPISSGGHCCIPEFLLADRSAQRLGVVRSEVMEVLAHEVKAQRLYHVDELGERLIYAPYLYQAEEKTARTLKRRNTIICFLRYFKI